MQIVTTDVLIVGAGPAGLTTASLLARAGVNALTLTKYGTANAPRAHITNQRAMEVMRDLGIEEQVAARALPQHLMGKQVFATSFAGRELSRMMAWGAGNDRIGEYRSASPCSMCNIAQHTLEPIMLARANELGADIRLHHEVLSVEQSEDQVTALVKPRHGQPEFQVVAKYAIGCDGSNTVVGRDGEFEYEGTAGLGDAVTVWIEADLTRYTAHRSGALFFTVTPGSIDLVGVWTCVEPWQEWSTIFLRPGLAPNDLEESSVYESIRLAIGDDDIAFKIRKISPWQFNRVVASNYQHNRLFVAGDAAHRHPPANGLGSNTSIQDAYNLAWKLAMVLRGQAGESLLATYNSERQPVGQQIVNRANQSATDMLGWFGAVGISPDMSISEAAQRLEELYGPDGEQQRAELIDALHVTNEQFNALGIELGQYYENGAVIPDDSEPATKTKTKNQNKNKVLHHEPSTRPGSPLPHAWLVSDNEDISTLDSCDYSTFTLITGAAGDAWVNAANEVSAQTNCSIATKVISLGQDINDVYGHWMHQKQISDAGCLLVRPDRIIAWRSMGPVDNPVATLQDVLTQLLR